MKLTTLVFVAFALGCTPATSTRSASHGATGAQGDQGPVGPGGPSGAEGPMGPRGFQGDQGPVGASGIPGPIGAQGSAGVAGPQGAQGAQGIAGPQGPVGLMGPAGATGPAGTGISKANVYQVTGVGCSGKGCVSSAACNTPNDVLLRGYCSDATGTMFFQGLAQDFPSPDVSVYACASSGVTIVAHATCIAP